MQFTYEAYCGLVNDILSAGYQITDYHQWKIVEKPCILRHDIDFSLKKAAEFSEFESSIADSVHSTYFVLLSTDFYNLHTKESRNNLSRIINNGHEIGLHFDETQYDYDNDGDRIIDKIQYEIKILSDIVNRPITTVSMHRPSKGILEANLDLGEVVNSYSNSFFHEFKYISDSRMNWREDPTVCIKKSCYDKIHILTHPFWYNSEEIPMKKQLLSFVESASTERYQSLNDNIRELNSILF